METTRFGAPWGKLLWIFTIGGTLVLIVVPVAIALQPTAPLAVRIAVAVGCLATLFFCARTAVRGYRLEGRELVIERLYTEDRVRLDGLERVFHDPHLMHGALRVGNGGLFAFAGYFWTRKHKWFRLAGNDILDRAVMLDLPTGKWVLTPDDPETFIEAIEDRVAGLA